MALYRGPVLLSPVPQATQTVGLCALGLTQVMADGLAQIFDLLAYRSDVKWMKMRYRIAKELLYYCKNHVGSSS